MDRKPHRSTPKPPGPAIALRIPRTPLFSCCPDVSAVSWRARITVFQYSAARAVTSGATAHSPEPGGQNIFLHRLSADSRSHRFRRAWTGVRHRRRQVGLGRFQFTHRWWDGPCSTYGFPRGFIRAAGRGQLVVAGQEAGHRLTGRAAGQFHFVSCIQSASRTT